jgi:hypothetical protein
MNILVYFMVMWYFDCLFGKPVYWPVDIFIAFGILCYRIFGLLYRKICQIWDWCYDHNFL